MSDIAAAAGASVGQVYRFFPSKEALVQSIVAADAQGQLQRFSDVAGNEGHAGQRMTRFIAELRSMLMDRDRTALMIEIAAEVLRNETMRDTLKPQHDAAQEIGAKLQEDMGSGLSRGAIELRLRLVNALASGAAIMIATTPEKDKDAFLDLVEQLAGAILVIQDDRIQADSVPG